MKSGPCPKNDAMHLQEVGEVRTETGNEGYKKQYAF